MSSALGARGSGAVAFHPPSPLAPLSSDVEDSSVGMLLSRIVAVNRASPILLWSLMLVVTLANGIFVGSTLVVIFDTGRFDGRGLFPELVTVWAAFSCWLIPACFVLSVPATVICEWLARGFLRNEPFVSWLLTFAMVGMTFGGGLGALSIELTIAETESTTVFDRLAFASAIAGMITGLTSMLTLAPIWYHFRADQA